MKKIFGAIAVVVGLALALVGVGALIGNNWAEGQIKQQLSQEKINMPSDREIAGIKDEACKKELEGFKGQALENGVQAKSYADCYIYQHMMEASGGKTYNEVSTQAFQEKDNKEINAIKETLFQGDTLRGMLLNAYAWWTVAQIAFWVGVIAIPLGLILAALGFFLMRGRKATAHGSTAVA